MKITITLLTDEGKKGLNKYFPNTTWFKIKCKLNNTIVTKKDNQIIINKTFSNTDKDKTLVVF